MLLVLLVTKAVSERSASSLRRIKNYLQTSMTQERLNHCMLLAIYNEMADKLSLINVSNESCFGSDERSRIFGCFFQNDQHFKLQQAPIINAKMSFFPSNSFRRTLFVAHHEGPSIKYVCKFYQKSVCAYQGVKNSIF